MPTEYTNNDSYDNTDNSPNNSNIRGIWNIDLSRVLEQQASGVLDTFRIPSVNIVSKKEKFMSHKQITIEDLIDLWKNFTPTNNTRNYIYCGNSEFLYDNLIRDYQNITQHIRRVDGETGFFLRKELWFELCRPKLLTESQETLITRLTSRYKNGLISDKEAINLLHRDIGMQFIYASDTRRFFPEAFARVDYFTKLYYEKYDSVKSFYLNTTWEKADCHETSSRVFMCHHSNKYFNKDAFTLIKVYDSSFDLPEDARYTEVCLEYAATHTRNGIHLWQDGKYRFHSEEQIRRRVPGYHSVHRTWLDFTPSNKIGVELEVFCPDRGTLNTQLPPNKDIFGESDGSLDSENGIELIGRPYEYSEYAAGKTAWNEVISKAISLKSIAFKTEDGREYGMHVSLSKDCFKNDLHLAKFVIFFNMQELLCKLVAQRECIYSSKYKIRKKVISGKTSDCVFIPRSSGADDRKFVFAWNTNKYEAVSIQDKRVECRIFRANLSWERFLKNIEFCMAVKDFTLNAGASLVSDETKGTFEFIKWLYKQSDFKHLKRFLAERTLTDGNSVQKITKLHDFRAKKLQKVIDNI